MPLFLSANNNPGDASWVSGALAPTPYTVGEGQAYSSIQAAIDAAVADGASAPDNQALVMVAPGTYVEDITLASGVYVQGSTYFGSYYSLTGILLLLPEAKSTLVVLDGTVTVDLPDGGGLSETNATGLMGFYVKPSDPSVLFTFSGSATQRCSVYGCVFEAPVGPAGSSSCVVVDNPSDSSLLTIEGCNFADPVGDTADLLRTEATNQSYVSVLSSTFAKVGATGNAVTHEGGTMAIVRSVLTANIEQAASTDFLFLEDIFSSVVTGACATIDGVSRISNFVGYSLSSTLVEGSGTIEATGPITLRGGFDGTPASFAATLTIDNQPNWLGTSPPGTWAGADPDTQQEALDRMAALLVTLNSGPIP